MNMISVIIPVYNSESTIIKCLDSLYAQTYQDFECILVNDGSTDDSLEIIEDYKKIHQIDNIKIISIENQGQGVARNVGIQKSVGDYISFVDSDDVVKEKYLEHMINRMDEDTDMVVGQIERCFEYNPNFLERKFKYSEDLKEFYHETIEERPNLMFEVINAPYAKLIRKKFLIENNISFAENIIYEDMVFTHRILSSKARVTSVMEKDYLYKVRKGSTMTSNKKVEDIFKAMDLVIEGYSNVKVNKEYLDYFIFHHVCIGGMYRAFKINIMRVLKFYLNAKKYVKYNECVLRCNSILSNKGWIIRIYTCLFS